MRPQKLSVAGPRLIPALAPQPLPMPMDRWFDEMETLSRVKEQIALLAEQDLKRPSSRTRDQPGVGPRFFGSKS
jgi:hypothetical protein